MFIAIHNLVGSCLVISQTGVAGMVLLMLGLQKRSSPVDGTIWVPIPIPQDWHYHPLVRDRSLFIGEGGLGEIETCI